MKNKNKPQLTGKPANIGVDSYSTARIKQFRRAVLTMSLFPVLVIALAGGVFYNFNVAPNSSRGVFAVTDPAEVRPFDPNHAVYQRIPTNVAIHPNSSQIVSNIASNNASFGFDTGGESPPIFIGKPTDPLWTINGGCGNRSVQVHAPTNLKAGIGSDYPLIILDQVNGSFTTSGTQPMEFRMWQASVNSGSRTISSNGLGIGSYRNDGAILSNVIKTGSNGPFVSRALGQAEACGQNTGSGESYTVGMIRPIDIQREGVSIMQFEWRLVIYVDLRREGIQATNIGIGLHLERRAAVIRVTWPILTAECRWAPGSF